MVQGTPSLEEVVGLAKQLSPADQLRVVERLASGLETKIEAEKEGPLVSLFGALAHLGAAPSAEDINEVRREMWSNFPRDDV